MSLGELNPSTRNYRQSKRTKKQRTWLSDVYNSGDRHCPSVLMSIDLYLCVRGMTSCTDYSYGI